MDNLIRTFELYSIYTNSASMRVHILDHCLGHTMRGLLDIQGHIDLLKDLHTHFLKKSMLAHRYEENCLHMIQLGTFKHMYQCYFNRKYHQDRLARKSQLANTPIIHLGIDKDKFYRCLQRYSIHIELLSKHPCIYEFLSPHKSLMDMDSCKSWLNFLQSESIEGK